ncbi:metallophosphoesterase [Georgenia satyanarayanai]|uniref:metallophosphoesterase family protein n=1 Tax=Georgenia satyanarayanai TaxID=860221 RepID=UPI00203D5D1F|nr:metallophosphoesterase [Georgenia satyanarayanai]MCM3662619.1 metallophosphoesterase [Georgenia satyanarayanai]
MNDEPTDLDPNGTRVVLAGDWHGDTWWAKSVVQRAARVGGVAMILQAGDAGFRWPGRASGKFDRKVNRELSKLDLRMVYVDGNHDPHDMLAIAPQDHLGFRVIQDRIRYAPRGLRWRIGGVVFAALGGAFSIDHRHRTAGRTWWPEVEEVRQQDVDALGDDPVDVLLTHDVPAAVAMKSDLPFGTEDADRAQVTRDLLQQAVERTNPRLVVAGHWHQRKTATIRRPGGETRVEVLASDGMAGDAVILNLDDLSVRPLPRRTW